MKFNKQKFSVVTGAGVGVLIAVVVSILLTGLYGILMLNGQVGESPSMAAVFLIRMVSVAIGGYIAGALTKAHFLPVVGIVTAGYLVLLAGTGIVAFDGSFKNFGSGVLSILLGGAVACITKVKAPKKQRKMPKLRR